MSRNFTRHLNTSHAGRASGAQPVDGYAAIRHLHDLRDRLAGETHLDTALNAIVVTATEFTGTTRGCIHLVSEDSQRLVLAAGHKGRNCLETGSALACEAARTRRERVIIEDIETAPALQGSKDREIALTEDIHAIQATPLISRTGDVVGVLSTQFWQPHRPSAYALELVDLLAWTTTEFVRQHRMDETLRAQEKHQAFLLRFSDALRPLAAPAAIKETATRLLGTQLQTNRATYFEVADGSYVVEANYAHGVPAIRGRHPIESFGSALYKTYCSDRVACDGDTEANPELSADERASFAAIQTRAHIGLPLIKDGDFIAGLAIHSAAPRQWTDAEIDLAREVAERTWAAVERARAEQARRDALADAQLLHRLAMDMAAPAETQALYEGVMDAAVEIMHSDYASLQAFIPGRSAPGSNGVLRLLAYRGATPDAVKFWERVNAESRNTCGMALRTKARSVVHDVETCESLAGSEDMTALPQTGIHALQTTPLFSRSGDLTGMLSTHWKTPHQPSERDLRMLDVLARHAADLIERKQAGQTRARLAAIVESSDDAIISKDLNGVMQTWNAGAQRLFGYTAEEAVGQSVTLLIPSERMDEEDDILRQVGQGQHIEHFETVRRHKDGTLLDVALSISPIVDNEGAIVGASKIARDITERRHIERLREQQARLLELIATGAALDECLNALCLAVTQISTGVRASICIADATRTTFQRVIAPELPASWGESFMDAPINKLMLGTGGQTITCEDVATEERWSREWRELCETNGVMAGHSVPVWSEDDEPVALFMLCFDRARGPSTWERELAQFGSRIASIALERNRGFQALREADRRKDEFMATLAHELRNPMAPLRNGLEIMRHNNPETTEKARVLMTRQLAQLTHLVDDLMDVSRITRGKMKLRKAQTDLSAVVHDAVETTRPRMHDAGHTVRVALPDEAIILQADADRLTQAIINLLTNAAKYTPANGYIAVDLEQRDNTAAVRVRDNGIGVAAERLDDIFDMFSQAAQPEGRVNEGLGIGLTLVKQVVELHGGTIKAHSEGAGRGTDFTVRLPLTTDAPAPTSAEAPIATESGKLRLLVVDDNPDVADSMMLLLDSLGHEVQVAHDGYQALEAAAALQPDAILLDIGLPGMDGIETARRLRATPEGRNVLLAALTGWGEDKDRHRTAEAGFDEHLLKPVEPEVLEQLLTKLKDQGSFG